MMTLEQLIEEGNRLRRACTFLRPDGAGPVAAVWHGPNVGDTGDGSRPWITVDSRYIAGISPSVTGYVTVFINTADRAGRVELSAVAPKWRGTVLYAQPASVLAPIDAVFARGSDAVGQWLDSRGWQRADRYNDNFEDAGVVREYERAWMSEFPLYSDARIYAMLGGWHWPSADDDWHDLIDEQLMVLTFRDAEPWVEAWRTTAGEFRVIQRIT